MSVYVCVCSRCAAVSYLRLCHRYVRSLKARPNDHYYHKHISNSNPSESFKLQLASALSCIYVYICIYVCMQLTFSCRLLLLLLLFIFCTLSFRTRRSRQFIVHFISLHLISRIPKRTTFYFPAIAIVSLFLSLSLCLSLCVTLSLVSLCRRWHRRQC